MRGLRSRASTAARPSKDEHHAPLERGGAGELPGSALGGSGATRCEGSCASGVRLQLIQAAPVPHGGQEHRHDAGYSGADATHQPGLPDGDDLYRVFSKLSAVSHAELAAPG